MRADRQPQRRCVAPAASAVALAALALLGAPRAAFAADSETWQFSHTIRRGTPITAWASPTNVTPTFDAYDWSYDITSVGVTAGGSGVPGDITWRFDAVADLDGSGTGGPLPLVIYDATWDEPDTGTLLDVEISVDSSGQARVLFDEIALGDLETDFGASSIPIDTLIVSGTISVAGRAAGLPGDYNGDDQVNAQDYTLWQVTFGSTTILAADGNGDGVVNAADYSVWRDAIDAQSAAAAAIPEPGVTVLAALAAARLLMRRAAS